MRMNLRYQSLAFLLLTGGLVASTGCARNSPARVELGPVDKANGVAEAPKGSPASRNGKFSFPTDQGGPLLRELLGPPGRLASDAEARPGPRPQPVPSELAHPQLPTSMGHADVPRRPLISRRPVLQPMSPSEQLPLANYRTDPLPTSRQEMRGGAPVRLLSRDVNMPPALPILGSLTVDRAPLDDPTTEESSKAALAATPPSRTNPALFMPRNLPDPFENGQTVNLRTAPAEEPEPTSGPVRTPKN